MRLPATLQLFAIARLLTTMTWIGLGVGCVSAVAVAAVCLPFPHGRSVFSPTLRTSLVPPPQARADFDVAQAWRYEYAQLANRSFLMPQFALSMALATHFPAAGDARSANIAAAATMPMPLPRPDGIARAAVARNAPLAIEPQVAALPPQPKQRDLGILDQLFGDPDRAAKAVLAANPNTALYDISKRVVYLPDGDKLEAHSGFGQWMDDPTSVARKDLGVTPPNVYAVSFREKPFHGVRALRMKPVGSGKMYGRDGILAHSYLLGEAGASNGCISVRDYDKFLQAFEAGKFNQIIVLRNVDEPVPAMVASTQAGGA